MLWMLDCREGAIAGLHEGVLKMNSNNIIRVLLVDDLEPFLNAAAAVLERHEFHVTAASSGPQALKEIKKGNIYVVILDMKMPGMDGYETLREIKNLRPDVQVIILTGHESTNSVLLDLREGAFAFLTKPCDIDILANKIREAFAMKRSLIVSPAKDPQPQPLLRDGVSKS